MKTKLILVEGIPGSGKSTFARRIADFYIKGGIKTNLYNEGWFHPADLAWNACVPLKILDIVLAPYEDFRDEIDKHIHVEDDYAIVSYTQVKTENEAFYKDMESYEVYDSRIPFEVFDSWHRKRWNAFCQQAKLKADFNVFECAFLQNHISELMLFQLADIETMKWYFNALIQTVAELSPVLIYLSQPNVRETIERVAKQRVFEHGSWIDGFIQYIENTPYGKLNKINGFDDIIQFLEKRKSVELKIINSLPIDTIVLENPNYDWETLWENLENELQMRK